MNTNTVHLHQVICAPPARVYRAFLDPAAMVKWLPPHGFTGTVHQLDATVGGTYTMSFTNFSTGQRHSFGGTYTELEPDRRIRHTDRFDDPSLTDEMVTTITLLPVLCGTDVTVVQEGIPGIIPVDGCHVGWQQSLALLAMLVEPNIPG